MKAEKISNLTDVELKHQERDLADQLFKLKFQMNMGQTESLKKIRGLRRDIARVQTVLREQELAGATKMQKTIVVEVTRKKAHPMYKRVISIRKKFYAHDEKNEAHSGDTVKIEESRPLSKLKRWTLKEIVRKTALVPEVDIDAGLDVSAKK